MGPFKIVFSEKERENSDPAAAPPAPIPSPSHRFHAHDGLLHLGDVGDVILVGAQLPLLYPLVDAHHHVSGNVRSVVHACERNRRVL